MAKQIKLRRDQQKARRLQQQNNENENSVGLKALNRPNSKETPKKEMFLNKEKLSNDALKSLFDVKNQESNSLFMLKNQNSTPIQSETPSLLDSLKASIVKLENPETTNILSNSFSGKSSFIPLIDTKTFAQQLAINANPITPTASNCQFGFNQLMGIASTSETPLLTNLPSQAQLLAAICQENNENVTTSFSHLLNLPESGLPMPKPIHPLDSLKALYVFLNKLSNCLRMPINQFNSSLLLNQAALGISAFNFPFNISNLLFNQYNTTGFNQILNNQSSTIPNLISNGIKAEIPSNRT